MADVDVSSSRCAGHVVVALRGKLDVVDAARLAGPRGTALYLLSLVDPARLLPVLASTAQAADGAWRPTASDRLAFVRVDGEALLGNGEVARARNDTSAAGSL
jgi:hypothetical protein